MSHDSLKLTTYFGERDRVGDRWLADALVDIYARHALRTSLVMRGTEGFGFKQHLRTDRLLSLSEDLPLVAVAVDGPERIEAAHEEVRALRFDGLVTLERAHALGESAALEHEVKLTVYVGRHEGVHRAIVALLHARGVAGATVLLGVDGTVRGARRRATFFGRNAEVPLMIVAVGNGARIAAALPDLEALLEQPLITLERVRVCKRDGQRLGAPPGAPPGAALKLMVYGRRPLHHELVRRLRRAGAAGATTLRGVWGYHGEHAPHGDSFRRLRRTAPMVTVVVDAADRLPGWFAVADALTADAGLVTCEVVPRMTVQRNLATAARLGVEVNRTGRHR